MHIAVWKDKHGDKYYMADTQEQRNNVGLHILQERVFNQYIDDDADIDLAMQILEAKDSERAWSYLMERNDYEYETISIRKVTEVEMPETSNQTAQTG